jgi:hypothetical protein
MNNLNDPLLKLLFDNWGFIFKLIGGVFTFILLIIFITVTVTYYLIKYFSKTTSSSTNVFYNQGPSIGDDDDPVDFGWISINHNTPVCLPNIPQKSNKIMVSVEGNSIRYRIDGGNPTSKIGHLFHPGDYLMLNTIKGITNFKMISISGESQINVTYFTSNK